MKKFQTYSKWTFDDDRGHYFKRSTRNTNQWSEVLDGRVKSRLEFKTLDGESVVLYDSASSTYIQLDPDRARIGLSSDKIESLDLERLPLLFAGKWN